jgi:hypothetical protein
MRLRPVHVRYFMRSIDRFAEFILAVLEEYRRTACCFFDCGNGAKHFRFNIFN